MLITIGELANFLLHEGDDLQAKLLGLVALTMMMTTKGNQTFGQADESDTKGTLVDDGCDGVSGLQLLSTYPEARHHEWELLGKSSLLELEALVQLLGGEFEHLVQTEHEYLDTTIKVRLAHALDGQCHDVDGSERDVATTDGGLLTETVIEHTCTATHGSHLIEVTLGIIGTPQLMIVEGGVEVQEVGEETTCRYLASELVKVVVGIGGQVVHTTLLLPNLDGEDCGGMVADTFVGRMEELTHHAASFSRSIGTIVDRREYHLVTTTRVDGVHVVDECLHSLMNTAYGAVHSLLLDALITSEVAKILLEVIGEFSIHQMTQVLALIALQVADLLLVGEANVRCKIEIEGGDSLTAVHFVLCCFQ